MKKLEPKRANFVHLRVHSAYSLLEGAIKIDDLVDLAKTNKMPAVAITDSNNMFGALDFSIAASKKGIQPIIGIQLNVTPIDSDEFSINVKPAKLVLLVANRCGYLNLMKLMSKSFIETEGDITPQVHMDTLEKLSSGLICLTGGGQGELNKFIMNSQLKNAERYLDKLNTIFKGNLYIELQRHAVADEVACEKTLIEYAYAKNIPLVATNDVCFATDAIFDAHDALMCIASGDVVGTKDRAKLNKEYYFKSADEMIELFKDIPEAIENTIEIAKRCSYKPENLRPQLPDYPYLNGRGEEEVLLELTKTGLDAHLKRKISIDKLTQADESEVVKIYNDRLKYEFDIIVKMGFVGYFLIVADFIKWAKEKNIPVGPGRGSGAGSIIAWSLGITDLDPIRFGLLFERFLNPERVSMPDFDIDFCQERRDEVIKYVQNQYGRDKVAQIITFGKLQAKAVIRDVGRVLSIPYGEVDMISKLIPNNPANPVTLREVMASEKKLQELCHEDPTIKRLISFGMQLEGLYRHASTHAAGVVIADRPISELVPLYKDYKSDIPVTQFSMKYVEQAGLVKFDFLGLKTLTIIQKAIEIINENNPTTKKLNIKDIPLDHKQTYEMLARGDTIGVFQLESAGMRKVLMQMQIDRFEDIIAAVSLYRPGPMEHIPTYIERKHGKKVEYWHPALKSVLQETYGIPVYQEQVMQMAQVLAGYSLGKADLLRRAMGKKIKSEMDDLRAGFNEGTTKKYNIDIELSNSIFDNIEAFAGYGFNKSHAAAYALIAYQTAWLKCNYNVHFMAATMTYDMANIDKLNLFKTDLDSAKIKILPPCINSSGAVFSVQKVNDGLSDDKGDDHKGGDDKNNKLAIRYCLCALKNVGESAVLGLIEEREKNGDFIDIYDFFERCEIKNINRRMLESLVRAGAFDKLCTNRNQLFCSLDGLYKYNLSVRTEIESGQNNLFGDKISKMSRPTLAIKENFKELESLEEEYKAVGFYLSAHPLSMHCSTLKKLGVVNYIDVESGQVKSQNVKLAGIVSSVRFITTQRMSKMAIVNLTDATGRYSVLFFDDKIEMYRGLLVEGKTILITCYKSVRDSGGENEIRLNGFSVEELSEQENELSGELKIFISNADSLKTIKNIFNNHKLTKGNVIIKIVFDSSFGEVEVRLKHRYAISSSVGKEIKFLSGVDYVDGTFE